MSRFLEQAGEILDVATQGDGPSQDVAIVLERGRGMRMLDPAGWSLAGLCAEFGAIAVYKIQRHGSSVRVEGWNGTERCLVQRDVRRRDLSYLLTAFAS